MHSKELLNDARWFEECGGEVPLTKLHHRDEIRRSRGKESHARLERSAPTRWRRRRRSSKNYSSRGVSAEKYLYEYEYNNEQMRCTLVSRQAIHNNTGLPLCGERRWWTTNRWEADSLGVVIGAAPRNGHRCSYSRSSVSALMGVQFAGSASWSARPRPTLLAEIAREISDRVDCMCVKKLIRGRGEEIQLFVVRDMGNG